MSRKEMIGYQAQMEAKEQERRKLATLYPKECLRRDFDPIWRKAWIATTPAAAMTDTD